MAAFAKGSEPGASPAPPVPSSWEGGSSSEFEAVAVTVAGSPASPIQSGQATPPAKPNPANELDDVGTDSGSDALDEFLKDVANSKVNEGNTDELQRLVNGFSLAQADVAKGGPPLTAEQATFKKAADSGEFEIRDAVGQKFQREHKKGSVGYGFYNKLATRDEKCISREQWTIAKFAKCVQGKRFEQEISTIETNLGEYGTADGRGQLRSRAPSTRPPSAVLGGK
jgi:hypothetical protein